jgi:nucleoside 2-deoxyribosyltransferase
MKPVTITICASNRFAPEAEKFAEKLKKLGVNVRIPHFYYLSLRWLGKSQKSSRDEKRFITTGLTLDHFQKIRKSDVIFIYNKDGYVGNGVTLEIGYATALDKPIYALSDKDTETCRDILFEGYAETPEKLIKML